MQAAYPYPATAPAPTVRRAPLAWKLKNTLRPSFVKGWLAANVIAPTANAFGVATMMGELEIRKRTWENDVDRQRFLDYREAGMFAQAEAYADAHAIWIDYGVVCHRVVTDAGVAYMVDDFDNGAGSADISLFNFHGFGTGTTAEAASQTALITESTTAINPDNTRATGTRAQPSANIYRSTGTMTFDASAAITEHGLFTDVDVSEGTLWDRSVFSAINVVSGDSIAGQYSVTLTAGS